MSQKREEYHDPDYEQFQPVRSQAENVTKKSPETKSEVKSKPPETRIEAIRRIVDREFQKELNTKEQELEEINKRLDETKKLLAKVRYAVVHHYYNQKSLICSTEEIAAVEKSQQDAMTSYPLAGNKPQMAIHPSLKKLLGKRPIDYNEILKTRPARRAAQNATEQFHKMAKKPTDTKIKMAETILPNETEQYSENKKPRYIAPSTSKTTIPQVNSARGRNIYRHLLVVGNISKYIGDEEAELATSVTHKWLIYVSTKNSVPVEQIVSRARFFLHDSYKPNDIVEVSSPPFQISKRGWGEFPVRVQLYFHAHLNQKPLQIFHTLILDKKHTGMQTMGAETIVELWLNVPNTVNDEESAKPTTSDMSSVQSSSSQSSLGRSQDFQSKSRTSSSKSPLGKSSTNRNSPCKSSTSRNAPCETPSDRNSPLKPPTPSPCKPLLPLFPTASPQALESFQPPTEMVIKQEPQLIEGKLVEEKAVIKQKPLEIPAINVTNEGIWQNGHQIPPQLTTPLNIKTMPMKSVTVPKLQICDQNNVNISNNQHQTSSGPTTQSSSVPNTSHLTLTNTGLPVPKGSAKKTFVKCVGKDGKVSLMELVRDEKNPKLFKMVLPPGVHANKMVLHRTNQISAPAVIPINFRRPTSNIVGQSVKISVPSVNPTGPLSAVATVTKQASASTLFNPLNTPMSTMFTSPVKVPMTLANPPNPVANTSTQLVSSRISLGQHISPSKNQLPTMPKLVAINSPYPTTSNLSRSVPSPKIVVPQPQIVVPQPQIVVSPRKITTMSTTPKLTSIQKSNPNPITAFIQKNNKVMILDTTQLPKTQSKSLLKPQVSLLKPRTVPTHSNHLKKITVNNISGLVNRNINVFVPADVKIEPNIQLKSQANNHKYDEELEQRFLARKSFTNMTEAIGWLLKETPLISPLATQSEFRMSFPFTVPSLADFHSLLIAKQRSFEWLRAKHVSRLILKHESVKDLRQWSTKDIILFGRWFRYTPQSVVQQSSVKMEAPEHNVREIVKSELIREHLQNDIISFNKKLTKWIDDVEENVTKGMLRSLHDDIIVVDDEDANGEDKKYTSPLKTNKNCMQLPIQCQNEVLWINEVCRRTQIRFGQEEIVEGVLHRSAELVFATALRSFLEDMLRKCCGSKQRTTNLESSNLEITSDDVLQTISSIQHFDFLTNKNLGIEKPNPSQHS